MNLESTKMSGPQIEFCDQLHSQKYRSPHEDFREAMNRVASTTSDDDKHYKRYREVIGDMFFLPGGRIQKAMGSTSVVTPLNCYVSGVIEDSFVDGAGCIMKRAHEAARTMRMGGGIGYDFSTLRPNGALIKKLNSNSSGPVSFMGIYNEVGLATSSSGHRRGAQMGVLRVDHPDIEEFVHAKQNSEKLRGFNISIAITDEFMRCVRAGAEFNLRFQGQVYRSIDARALWESIMRSTWDWAEPGVLFIDTINRMNNLKYCESIAATNPCGEQPLPPNGACLLGSFNLVKYVQDGHFDFDMLAQHIPDVVRAMDNVFEHAKFPLYEQEQEAKNKRRMGLGVTGAANAIESLGMPYGSDEYVDMQSGILRFIANQCYQASALLAKEKGAFPMYNKVGYMQSEFVERLDPETKALIERHGIRNSHLTSIAPTGTISMCADNVSSGIEPVFSYKQKRMYNHPDGMQEVELEDYGVRVLGHKGRTATGIVGENGEIIQPAVSVAEHLAVLKSASHWVDSAVSKTCNIPPNTPWSDFKQVYVDAWEGGAKGCTTFNTEGKRMGIIKDADSANDGETCRIDATTGRRECE